MYEIMKVMMQSMHADTTKVIETRLVSIQVVALVKSNAITVTLSHEMTVDH